MCSDGKFDMGSPPQVRGKHLDLFKKFGKHRITPAGAGKTCLCWASQRNYWDHPRRCGENAVIGFVFVAAAGSPPQVRGKRLSQPIRRQSRRITPAGAGKTWVVKKIKLGQEDHPRRCGENYPI